MKKIIRLILGLAILAVLVYLAVLAYRKYAGPKDRVMFRTDTIRKTDLVRSITATGTVEPEELVNVGAQVQGMITKFGPDTKGKPVDYGSIVKEGGVLAWIDDSLYAAELRSAQAAQLQANASINSANSNILQAKARLQLAELNMKRAKQLHQLPFQIFSDATLQELVLTMPMTLEECASVKGVGPAKLRRFMPAVLELIRQYREESAEL